MRRWAIWVIVIFWPFLAGASLKGSKHSLEAQNEEADREDLTRIQDDVQLEKFKNSGLLVKIPEGMYVLINPRLEPKWRWCRPWTLKFVNDLGHDYFLKFHQPLEVNSAVRTADYQTELRKWNSNATTADGKDRSSHLTGATVDLAKKEMSKDEKKWVRQRLLLLQGQSLVRAIEENREPCFHVMVFKQYHSTATRPLVRKKRRG